MKLKLAVLLVLAVSVVSCRKEYASFQKSPSLKEFQANRKPSENFEKSVTISSVDQNKVNAIVSAEERKESIREKKYRQKQGVPEKQISKGSVFSERKDKLKSKERVKKEMNPRLSRALWMTIPSGLAVVLGILLYSVAPTGLFIFAFSIVFLVGLVSLLLYLANPKPKM